VIFSAPAGNSLIKGMRNEDGNILLTLQTTPEVIPYPPRHPTLPLSQTEPLKTAPHDIKVHRSAQPKTPASPLGQGGSPIRRDADVTLRLTLLHHWAAGGFECLLMGTVSAKFFRGACVASDSWKVADRFSW